MNTRTITIPRVPFSINKQERWHWMRRNRERQEWIFDVFYLVKEYGNAIPKHLDHIKITKIVIYFSQIRIRDESNYEPMIIKPLADALVKAEIIPDDTAKYITRPGAVMMEMDRKNPRTEVTLEWKQ